MNFKFNSFLADQYKNNSQKIRVMSESWVAENIFCPCCGNPSLKKLDNNKPVADFSCDNCNEVFELKSKSGKLGKKINDGAYNTMIDRITSISNPDLFLLSYNSKLETTDLIFIPKFFFTPDIIEKRKPLSPNACRAGWIGCNILISDIPNQGKIEIIKNQNLSDVDNVVHEYNQIKKFKTDNIDNRSWTFDVMNCVNKIKTDVFVLADIYRFVDELQPRHPDNHNIEAKIRQQLQILRDKGFIEFLGHGKYRKIV